MLTLTPVVCVLSAIAFSSTFDIYLDDKERLVDGKEEGASSSKKSNNHDTGKKKKKDREREKDSSDMVRFILSFSMYLVIDIKLCNIYGT